VTGNAGSGMTNVSETKNVNFIHINKTGGTSIKKALELPAGKCKHMTAREVIRDIGRDSWGKSFSFVVVRNPWDKVISHYFHRVKTNQTGLGDGSISFNDWVKLAYGEMDPRYYDKPLMFMPQLDWIVDDNMSIVVDHVCRFENLEQDFKFVCDKLGSNASLTCENATSHMHYRSYYNQESADIVASWFCMDIEEFGYRF